MCESATVSAKNFNHTGINRVLADIHSQFDVAAVSVLVVSEDQVLLDVHSGVRDWTTKIPFSDKDMYRIGSISKSFAGVLALRLQQQGLIDLSDSIEEFGLTPYLINAHSKQVVTLAQLLEHTAGLKDLAKAEWDYSDPEAISLKQAFELKLGHHKTHWSSGMHRSYSNVGPGLFGLALELKLGQPYESLMQTHVFDPLNMNQSSLLMTPRIKQKLIKGYDRDGKKPIQYWHNIYRPFAAINSNNQDMVKWLQMLLKKSPEFLKLENQQRLVQPRTTLAARNGLKFGYGLGVYQWQTNGYSFYGHGGDADGYLTRYGYNPDSGLAYFVMINAFNHQPLNRIVQHVEQQIITGLPKPKYPLRLALTDNDIKEYAGKYRQVTSRFGALKFDSANHLTVTHRNGQLFYQLNKGKKVAIHKVRDNQFRNSNQSVATMAFVSHSAQLYFQGEFGNFVKITK